MTSRRRLSRVLAPLAAVALALGLAACSSSGGSPAPAGNSLDSMAPSALLAQANKEGSVTWYTTFSDDDVQPFIDAFNKVYATYYHADFPARAFIGVPKLLFGARFEVMGIAVRQKK